MVERYGEDMHDLPGLFEKCRQVKSEGGLFEIVPSPTDFGIKSIHVQARLMRAYAMMYPDLKIVDGTTGLSQYDFTFILFSCVCYLMRTHITGITANFSKHSDAMIEGANMFFHTKKSSCDYVKTGEFADNFCPFSGTIIKTASKEQRSDDVDAEPNEAEARQKEDEPTLISDEGPGIQLMAEHFGWNQIFDRKHITTKIVLCKLGWP